MRRKRATTAMCVSASGALRQHRKPMFGRHHIVRSAIRIRPVQIFDSEDELVAVRPSVSSVSNARPAARYESAEAYAVEVFARLPAMRLNSATCSRSSADVMRREPRLS